MTRHPRPLSPHLTIYKKQISSVLSILHRMTGFGLFFGALLLVAWLAVAAYAPTMYGEFTVLATSGLGQLVLLGFTLAFYYHLCNGIRHLFWDIGKGFSVPAMTRSGWLVVVSALVLTALSWSVVL
jgi:succinate dehydrogenase / fumarate reductase cytochrome b subunit